MKGKPITPAIRAALFEALRRMNLTQRELAQQVGISSAGMSKIIRSDTRAIHYTTWAKLGPLLEPYLQEPVGLPEPAEPPPDPRPLRVMEVHAVDDTWRAMARRIPVVYQAWAANQPFTPTLVDQIDLQTWNKRSVPANGLDPSAVLAFEVKGDSMEPDFREGDVAIFDRYTSLSDVPGRVCLAVFLDEHGDEQIWVKRVRTVSPAVILESLNPKYAPVEIPCDRVKFLWRWLKLIREAPTKP